MKYKRMNDYLEIIIDETFTNKSILEVFETYRLSKKHIHELRMSKDVYVNELPIDQYFNRVLMYNDRLKFKVFVDEELDFKPQKLPLEIIYEDDFLLIINKQIGIEVHPDSNEGLNTLVNAVAHYYQKTDQKHRVRYIHRLDRDTTGGIVFVKNYFTHNLYDNLLNNKDIKRFYLAVVENKPPQENGIIEAPIGKDRHHNQKRVVSKTGEYAKTGYKIIKSNHQLSLLELELYTGKTHQIRVHLNYIKCPIIGDPLYGNPSQSINRQALHAYKISLLHPVTLQPFDITIPNPRDIQKLIDTI